LWHLFGVKLPGESLGGVDSLLVPKRAKRKNQAWGSNPESRPVAYHIGKSRLTIGPTRLNVVQPRFITPQSPSSLAHTHKGAKILRGCAALSFFFACVDLLQKSDVSL
jgi:hypothetical protein